jgi:hypothetical protein
MTEPASRIEDLERRIQEVEENANNESPRRRHIKTGGAVVTFVIALVGAVLGGVSFFNEQRIKVNVTAAFTERQRAWTYQLGIVNSSARAVNIVSGEVFVDDQLVGNVEAILPFVTDVADLRTEAELQEAALELPYSVGAGASIAGTVMYDTVFPPADVNIKQWERTVNLVNDPEAAGRIRLRLKFEPGGEENVTVRFVNTGRLVPFLDVDHLPGWHSWIDLKPHRGIRPVFKAGGPGDAPALATLQLWRSKRDGRPFFTRSQPLIRGWTEFPLPALKRGAYVWALMSASKVVAVGEFAIPCKGEKRLIQPDTDC